MGNANCCQGNVQAPIAAAATARATRHRPVIGNLALHANGQLCARQQLPQLAIIADSLKGPKSDKAFSTPQDIR